MPISLPNLDDRRYADLVEEALALIPVHAPEWTNHNASDPGITLVELFAYLTEMLIYRLNRVTVENKVAFLNLIDAGKRKPDDYRDPARLNEEVRNVIRALRRPARAVTAEDYEALVLEKFPEEIARVRVVPRRNLSSSSKTADAPDHMSVIVVMRSTVLLKSETTGFKDYSINERTQSKPPFPLLGKTTDYLYVGLESQFTSIQFEIEDKGAGYDLAFEYFTISARKEPEWKRLSNDNHKLEDHTGGWTTDGAVEFAIPEDWGQTEVNGKQMYWVRIKTEKKPVKPATAFRVVAGLLKSVKKYLEPLRMLATIVHVVEPSYVRIGVQLTLHLEPDAIEDTVRRAAIEELSRFFHPLNGWRDGKGWPFGRSVYLSEVIERLAQIPGVDYVKTRNNIPHLSVIAPANKEVKDGAIPLEPYELVDSSIDIKLKFATKPALARGDFRA